MTGLDTIVIGSGAGGLCAALSLARAGHKVLVLEQHYVPGGWCHNFHLNGQRFSPGVHYIGLADKGKSTSQLYEGLGIANDLVFFRMNPDAYEHYRIGNASFDIPAGFERLYETLAEQFPHEKKSLRKYLDLVKRVSEQVFLIPKMNSFMDHLTIAYRTRHMGKYGLFTLKRVIDWHIKDPLLKDILNMQCGDHGLPPGKVSFPYHCGVMSHYFEGGFYPMGGGAGIVKAMTTAIKNHGGEIRTGQKVKRILTEGDRTRTAVGVELENGEQIRAKNIVSNADPGKTFLDMAGPENLSGKLRKKLDRTRYSASSLILFLTVDMDVRKAGIDSGNIWVSQEQDLDRQSRKMLHEDILADDEFPALFISCSTLKDSASFNGRYYNFELVTLVSPTAFKQFEGKEDYKSETYVKYKERLCEKFINSLQKILPGVRDHIVQMELGTPKTNEFYINSTMGNIYGTEKSLFHIGPFAYTAKTEIRNLYLCGASTMSHGVAGAGFSGVQAAAAILKCKAEDILVPDKEQNLRIYEAEDSSTWPEWLLKKLEDRRRRFKEADVLSPGSKVESI